MPSYLSNMVYQYWTTIRRKDGSETTTAPYDTAARSRSILYGSNYSDWKDRIKTGRNATTSLTGTDYTYRPAYMNYSAHHSSPHLVTVGSTIVYRNIMGFAHSFPNVSPTTTGLSLSRANNRALTQFVQRAIAARRSMQGGVFLGELRQTIAAVRNPARALRRGFDDYAGTLIKRSRGLRRLPPSRRRITANRIVSDTWLEYNFGWAPLFSDIRNGAEALAKSRIEPTKPKTKFVQGNGKDSTGVVNTSGGQHSVSGLIIQKTLQIESFYSIKYYGKVRVYHPSSLVSQLGLLPEDFVPTVWELVPWSFVADYFTNIGDLIQAACFLRSNMAWVSKGQKTATETKVVLSIAAKPLNTYVTGSGHDGAHSVVQVSRAPYLGSLVPDLEFEIPGFGRKWINLGALANSLRQARSNLL